MSLWYKFMLDQSINSTSSELNFLFIMFEDVKSLISVGFT